MKYFILIGYFFVSTPLFVSAQTVEKSLATVDGDMITLLDLKQMRYRLNQNFMDGSALLSLFKKSQLQKKNSVLLQFLIYKKLLDNAAVTYQEAIKNLPLKKEINTRRKKRKLSKKAFSKLLVKNNFTAFSYKAFLKKSILRQIFIQKEITEKFRLSDQNLNEYALQTQGKPLFTSFKYELAYLSFPLTKAGKTQAQIVVQKLKKDVSFFDKWHPNKKGEKKEILKPLNSSAIHPTIKTPVQQLSIGQTSALLTLPTGYHIFKLLWKIPIITAHNKKRKISLSKKLFHKQLKQKLKFWLKQKQKQSFVKINS